MSFVAKDTIRRNGGDLDMQILENVQNAAGSVAFDRTVKVARVALADADTLFSWANPEATSIIVTRVILDITTASSAACTIDVGTTATTSTTSSENLIDSQSLATIAVLDNLGNAGTNGKARQKLAAGKWVTGTKASGATAGIVGFAYIHYHTI
jgi:hypothetical protein